MTRTPARFTAAAAPLDIADVATTGGWLQNLQRRNADATLPHCLEQLEVSGTLENLRRAAEREHGAHDERAHVGYQFSDSDVHKTLEAIGWEIARTGTHTFDAALDQLVALLADAQEDDGYLNSWGTNPTTPERWSDLPWGHELYTGGHLVQAAIALARAGRPELLAVARRWADLVVTRFGPGKAGYCGHPEVETALVELWRETGERSYLDTARALLDRRGAGDFEGQSLGLPYFQDHAGVREVTEATGHAVRQLYLDAGCADLYAETVASGQPDQALLDALVARWESAHQTKLYLTGAMGSRHRDEAFGAPYELPPDRAYAETCAAIADVMLSWRLLLLTGEARYADAIERVLHNALPASLSTEGTAFFYSDPLQLRSGTVGSSNAPVRRTPWYACACCPPNIARLVASLGGYLATTSGDTVTLQQYADVTIQLPEPIGGTLQVTTSYPVGGFVEVTAQGVAPGSKLRLRIPPWATDVRLDDVPVEATDGYVTTPLTDGVPTVLSFDVSPRLVTAHPKVDAVRGCVAVVRGPVVLCAEQADLAGTGLDLESLVFEPAVADSTEGEAVAATVRAWSLITDDELYRPYGVATDRTGPYEVTLHPYAQWGNREPGPMRVWLPLTAFDEE